MRAHQIFLALRLRSGLILTLFAVSQRIKTELGTALYLTPSPQTKLSLEMSSLISFCKVRVCVYC